MKAGLVYALVLVIVALAVIILFQQRKLAEARTENAAMHGDARALNTRRNEDAAANVEVQREVRQLRGENEQLRKDNQQLRERAPTRSPER